MNTKKKCCGNCIHFVTGAICYLVNPSAIEGKAPCDYWQRNPDLWLDILPEEEGVYWERRKDKLQNWMRPAIVDIIRPSRTQGLCIDGFPLVEYDRSYFQGPIKPKE